MTRMTRSRASEGMMPSPGSKIPRTPVRQSISPDDDDGDVPAHDAENFSPNASPAPAPPKRSAAAKRTIVEKKPQTQASRLSMRQSMGVTNITWSPRTLLKAVTKEQEDEQISEKEAKEELAKSKHHAALSKAHNTTKEDPRGILRNLLNAPIEESPIPISPAAPDIGLSLPAAAEVQEEEEEEEEVAVVEEHEAIHIEDDDIGLNSNSTASLPSPSPSPASPKSKAAPAPPSSAPSGKIAKQCRKGVLATIADTVLDLSTAASALAFLFFILVVSLSAPHACSNCTLSNLPACSCDYDAIREAVATAALTLSESVMGSDPYSYPRGNPDTVPIGDSYDYVIVGSGLAGSTLASSLHSRDPTASILILEAGSCSPSPSPIPSLSPPASGSFLWEGSVSRAKVCGGATALKGGAVARSVAPVSGMWGDSVWRHHMAKAAKMHNTASHVPVESEITRAFSSASSSLSPPPSSSSSGRIRTSGTVPAATSPRGLRISASQRIIAPAMRSKLGDAVTLASNAHVTRILFGAGGAVSGVEVARGTPRCALCAIHCGLCGSVEGGGKTLTVKASREVLLSAGAVGSAHLLLLSGIGPAPELAKFGVPLVANLPVGETLSDAVVAPMEFDQAGSGGAPLAADTLLNRLAYLVTRQGPMGTQPPQAVSWKEGASASPQPLVRISSDPSASRVKVEASVVSPSGLGTVKLTSSDPTSPPAVSMDPKSNADDMMALVEAVKMGHYITIAEGMKRLLGPRSDPGGVCPNPVEGRCQQYDVKHMARAAGQRAATTPMGRVVDESLRVMGGVRGLRVVDTAAALSSCGGSDEWCSAAIAEKAAELVALTWAGKRQ